MSGTQPVGVYAMKVPPGDILLPAVPDFAAMFRVSMAAIDPTEEPTYDDDDTVKKAPRATLKIVRVPGDMFGDDDDDDDSEDDDEMDLLNGLDEDSDEDSDEEANGGPSEPKKATKATARAKNTALEEDEDMDDSSDEDDKAAIAALQKAMKGKAKADGSDDEEEDDLEDDDPLELEEVVVCTLDPEKHYQQTLDFVVGEDERVFFKVSGTHTVHLTGNYVIPMDDGQAELYSDEEDEEDYDLSPDEDELDEEELVALADEESDELDDLEDPRVTEVASDDEVPALLKATDKGKNKRPAEDSADEGEEGANLDDLMAKALKKDDAAAATNGDTKKLSKAEKKKLKKLKKNDGEAADATAKTPESKEESKKETAATNGTEKKSVQFAKNLEQGPTPSKTADKKVDTTKSADSSASIGIKDIQGVTVDERKVGKGPAAKKGSRIEMRYIGKLESGKVFDSNKKGKPFSFKLGMGEVIKGWDIGVVGMSAGGERRLTIPAHHGYGKKGAPPDIPPNAKLIFDIKCLSVA